MTYCLTLRSLATDQELPIVCENFVGLSTSVNLWIYILRVVFTPSLINGTTMLLVMETPRYMHS